MVNKRNQTDFNKTFHDYLFSSFKNIVLFNYLLYLFNACVTLLSYLFVQFLFALQTCMAEFHIFDTVLQIHCSHCFSLYLIRKNFNKLYTIQYLQIKVLKQSKCVFLCRIPIFLLIYIFLKILVFLYSMKGASSVVLYG